MNFIEPNTKTSSTKEKRYTIQALIECQHCEEENGFSTGAFDNYEEAEKEVRRRKEGGEKNTLSIFDTERDDIKFIAKTGHEDGKITYMKYGI